LTVLAGLRRAAAFGFAENNNIDQVRALKKMVDGFGIYTRITTKVRTRVSQWPSDLPAEALSVFDELDRDDERKDTNRLLWIFYPKEVLGDVYKALKSDIQIGTLLSYPQCCTDARDRERKLSSDAFAKAIIAKVGSDPDAVRKALCE